MYLGTQVEARNSIDFEVWAQLGVINICSNPKGNPHDYSLEYLENYREQVESCGITLDMIQLPLSSTPLDKSQSPNILLGRSPERDREIDSICELICNMAKAGIPAAKYNLNIIGVPRTAPTEGRGGSSNSTFRWAHADQNALPGIAGELDEDENWERIDYFLERVVPVAEENKIRLACHPHDPYTPPGYMGVTRVLGTPDGLEKFVKMRESPYHGLNFCQGTISEMLEDPGGEICDLIRWFGKRKKIFNVHFRNIRGKRLDFVEVFPDEGDVDMVEALRTYRDVGYEYMLMPDHVPQISGANGQGVAFAFCYGYIQALLQAVSEEVL